MLGAIKDKEINTMGIDKIGCFISDRPKKIIYNENKGVTIVMWEDGTKTIVLDKKDKNMLGTFVDRATTEYANYYKRIKDIKDIENTKYIKKEVNTMGLDFSHEFAPRPKKIIYNESKGGTVVLWEDGTKTIVKCSENDQRDLYNAYCAAFAKKCYGTNSALKREIDKLTVYYGDKNKETA